MKIKKKQTRLKMNAIQKDKTIYKYTKCRTKLQKQGK